MANNEMLFLVRADAKSSDGPAEASARVSKNPKRSFRSTVSMLDSAELSHVIPEAPIATSLLEYQFNETRITG